MTTFCLRHLNATRIPLVHFIIKKSISVILGLIKSKNFIYPEIFDQQSLQTQAESHTIQILQLKSVATKLQIVHFVFIVEQDVPLSKTSKMVYRCWWVNFPFEKTSRWPKLWSPSWSDMNPIDSSLWFLLWNIASSPSDADTNHKIRSVSFRRNMLKTKMFSPYFSV